MFVLFYVFHISLFSPNFVLFIFSCPCHLAFFHYCVNHQPVKNQSNQPNYSLFNKRIIIVAKATLSVFCFVYFTHIRFAVRWVRPNRVSTLALLNYWFLFPRPCVRHPSPVFGVLSTLPFPRIVKAVCLF